MGRGIPSLPAGGGVWEEARPFPRKKRIFHLKWRVLMNSERYFVYTVARKMLKFQPEVVIWWTLKMYFWEVVNTMSELRGC